MKKKLLLVGYFGEGNFGDEMILKNAYDAFDAQGGFSLRILCRKSGNAKYRKTAAEKTSPLSILRALLWADAVVSPGGNLLQDESSFLSLCYYTLLFRTAKLLRKKVFFLSSGFGAFSGKCSLRMAGSVLQKADGIGVRSLGDCNTAARLSSPEKPPILMPDICFLTTNIFIKRKIATFSVIYGPGKVFSENEIRNLENQTGLRAKRILFHKKEDLPEGGKQEAFHCPKSEEELFDLLADSAFVLSARYHGAVFSLIAGVPCFLTAKNEKCRFFLADYAPFCKPYPEGEFPALTAFVDSYRPGDAAQRVRREREKIHECLQRFLREM